MNSLTQKDNNPVLLVDGLNLFMRSFSVSSTVSELGEPIGGTVGFLRTLGNIIDHLHPQKVFVIWEGGGSIRKRNIFPDYKKGSKPFKMNNFYKNDYIDKNQSRNYQLSLLTKILKHTNISQIYLSNCEADDVIGYISKNKCPHVKKIIVSSDQDMYQLVNDKVTVWSPGIKKIVDENYVYSKFGIRPYNFCLARCFIGDKSDNLKGIKGLGFKTLLKRFPDLSSNENIELNDLLNYAGVMNETTKLKIYNSVVDNKHLLRRNWKIMYLDTLNLSGSQVEKINFLFEQTTPKVDKINLMRILVKHGINSFNVDKFVMSIKSSIV